MAKLYFRYGAMGSSKTANAIMVKYNYWERGQNALMLKPMIASFWKSLAVVQSIIQFWPKVRMMMVWSILVSPC